VYTPASRSNGEPCGPIEQGPESRMLWPLMSETSRVHPSWGRKREPQAHRTGQKAVMLMSETHVYTPPQSKLTWNPRPIEQARKQWISHSYVRDYVYTPASRSTNSAAHRTKLESSDVILMSEITCTLSASRMRNSCGLIEQARAVMLASCQRLTCTLPASSGQRELLRPIEQTGKYVILMSETHVYNSA
jgi:hypothetical protein